MSYLSFNFLLPNITYSTYESNSLNADSGLNIDITRAIAAIAPLLC